MEHKTPITILVLLIIIISIITTTSGIFSNEGTGKYDYESIRGKTVEIYGKGIYKHMSSEVAIQGIAQDYVTLFVGVPLLLFSLFMFRKNSIRGKFILSGVLGYFFVTFLFYTAMGMYNYMFLCYCTLLGLSFFALFLTLISFDYQKTQFLFSDKTPNKLVGGFLIFNSVAIAFLWLNVIVKPLVEGSIYPKQVEHYTTLIVQGFDLGLLLPIAFICGVLLILKKSKGYIFATSYIVFLSILMTSLTAKIIAMADQGINVIPVVFIIPTINVIALICSVLMIKNIGISYEKN